MNITKTTNLGIIANKDKTKFHMSECCCFTKSHVETIALIPVEWAENVDVDYEKLKSWVSLINEAFGFEIVLEQDKKEPLLTSHIGKLLTKGKALVRISYDKARGNDKIGPPTLKDNKAFRVIIDTTNPKNNYCAFILIRYAYSHHFYPVVHKALEIYPLLKTGANKALKAVLMAHLGGRYDPFYGLIRMTNKFNLNFLKATYNSTSFKGYSLNDSFTYLHKKNKRNRAVIKHHFKNNDFSALEEYLDSFEID